MSFANIFMAEIETNLILQNNTKPRVWKRYIDDVFSLWDCNRNEVERFIQEANSFHPTIKFTAEISENEITFLDTVVFKGERFIKDLQTLNDASRHAGIQRNIESSLSEVTFDSRQSAFKSQKQKTAERILPFVTTYHPAVNKLKQIVMENWRFIENQPC